MCRLICAFVVCKWHKQVFPWHGSNMNTTCGSYSLQVIHLTTSVEAEVNVDGRRNRCRNWGNVGLLYRVMLRQMQQEKQQIYYMYMYMSKFSLLYNDRFFFIFYFYFGFTAHQNYFTHFEPSQSLGGAKTGGPREKLPDHLQAELGLSHETWARLESTAMRWRAIWSTND